MKQITIDRELHGQKWKHFGCPKCGYIASLPVMGEKDDVPWCVHDADNHVWPWFLHDGGKREDGSEWAGPMVPITVTYDETGA